MRAGYKQTEVGVIPEAWEVKFVAELGTIKTGPFGTLLKASEYSGTQGVPLISVGEVGGGSFKIEEHTPRVPEVVVRRLPQYVLRTGDIVFGRKGAVERSALVTKNENGWFLGSDGISVRPQGLCYPPYLAWQFQRQEVQGWLLQHAIGTTMPSLNQGILNRVQIPYAPQPEQRAIAEALSDVDGLLGALNRLIAKKRDLKQAAMQKLLTGQIRLPGFEVKLGYEQSEVGEIPKDWDLTLVREKGEVVTGKALAVNGPGKQRPYLRTKNVFDGRIEIDDVLTMPMTDEQFAHFRARRGDVLLNEGQSLELVGRCAMYHDEYPEPCAIQNQLIRFRARAGVSGAFASCLFRYCQQTGVFEKVALQTTSIAHLGGSRFGNLRLGWPKTEAEQTAIAEALFEMDAELAGLKQQREKTRALKQGMMQELLTGRTRLV